jgi:tripartite-type tricarboxylate transporter receptor subunit TctC
MEPATTTPAQAADFIKADAQRWADVIRAAGVTAD